MKTTKKSIIFGFLEKHTNQITMKESYDLFLQENPNSNIDKASFSSYRSGAISEGIFTPKTSQILSVSKTPLKSNEMELEVKIIKSEDLDPSNFVQLFTGTTFDTISSDDTGLLKNTQYMITGESGAGKTTICTTVAQLLKEYDPTVTAGFISGEMTTEDWKYEVYKNPQLSGLETIFLLDYIEASNYIEILQSALERWDFVILDSFEVILDQIKEIKGWTGKKAESELINMIRLASNKTSNIQFVIQQYTKGGTFVGSNKIKHLFTGLAYVKIDNNGDRYFYFEKNRRCGKFQGTKLYFNKNKKTNMLEFNGERFENEQEMKNFSQAELDRIQEEKEKFNDGDFLEIARKAQQNRERLERLNKIQEMNMTTVTISESVPVSTT